METAEMKQVWAVQKCIKKEAAMRDQLLKVKRRLEAELETIKTATEIEYSGWYCLLVNDGAGFRCVGIFNPQESDEEVETEWDFAVPIPKPETYPEFQGW